MPYSVSVREDCFVVESAKGLALAKRTAAERHFGGVPDGPTSKLPTWISATKAQPAAAALDVQTAETIATHSPVQNG